MNANLNRKVNRMIN